MLLGFVALGFLVLLLAIKILAVLELRSREQVYRRNQAEIAELQSALDTSRRRYLIALKAEGVSRYKVSQLKTRYTELNQHFSQIEKTVAQQGVRKKEELEQKLEALVMKALGGTSVRRDSHFKRVMSLIRQLIDLDKHGNSEELVIAIQEKLAEMRQRGAQAEVSPGVEDSARTDATTAPVESGVSS